MHLVSVDNLFLRKQLNGDARAFDTRKTNANKTLIHGTLLRPSDRGTQPKPPLTNLVTTHLQVSASNYDSPCSNLSIQTNHAHVLSLL